MSKADIQQGTVAVIGAGVMGVGIAQVLAVAGHPVRIFDPQHDARASVLRRLAAGCAAAGADAAGPVSRVAVTESIADACAGALATIEAGPENRAVKREILAEIEAAAPAGALIGTNTSSIPVGELDDGLRDPGRFVGTHFWHPPYLVPLVEVVRGPRSEPASVARMIELLTAAQLRPIAVEKDVAGIIGNRLQHALKREAIALVAAGVASAATVDAVVRHGFGRRLALVGPLEQADLGGLDLTMAIHEVLMPDLDVTPVPHPMLAALVARGDLGAKTGRGFFEWQPGAADRRRAEIAAGLAEQHRVPDLGTDR